MEGDFSTALLVWGALVYQLVRTEAHAEHFSVFSSQRQFMIKQEFLFGPQIAIKMF